MRALSLGGSHDNAHCHSTTYPLLGHARAAVSGTARWFRWLGPYVLIDQVFALTQVRDLSDDTHFRHYYLAAGFTFWFMWAVFTGLGIILAPIILQLALGSPLHSVSRVITHGD